jgi:glutathione S-transferase
MHLYFSPLACSLATRISLYEAGADARYSKVDLKQKRLPDGSSYFDVVPMGQVPALVTDDGVLLTENTAVLQYVADRHSASHLAPASGLERSRLQQWLAFINTELHKAVFVPLLDPKAPDAVKAYSREKIPLRLSVLERHLSAREFVLDEFSVADAYLTTILNWAAYTQTDLNAWPAVAAYYRRMLKRPSIARALAEEFAMYEEEQAAVAARA